MSVFILGMRACVFYLGYSLLTAVYGICSVILLLLPRVIGRWAIISWIVAVLGWLRLCCGVRYQVLGDAHKSSKPYVLVSNHQSPLETFFLQKEFFPLVTVLKKQLLSIPFFGWGLRLMEPIAIDRSTPTQALKQVKKMGVQRLQNDSNLLIFPEGTRMPVGQLGTFKRSAVDIAKAANVPIIPLFHNSGEFWLNKKFIKKPGVAKVIVGNPIDPQNKDSKEIMAEIQAWMEQQLNAGA